ncbi:MAG: Adenylate cyclase [Myxococcales bacterium]|nr:Adenylate cyclase [Myxococcales bacterium]
MGKPAPIEGVDRDTALDEAARRCIAARLADVRTFEERLTGAADADDVHDMRVASRRLRAALALFDRKRQLREAEKAVRALGEALGEVRELHVQLEWLRGAGAAAAEKERHGIAMLLAERELRLPRRVERLEAAVATWTAEGWAAVEAGTAGLKLDGRLGGHRVRRRLARQLKDVKRRMVAVAKKAGDVRAAHKLRIEAKKLRYAAELAQPAFPADMDALLDRVQPLQELLGNLHDADVHIPLVEKFLVRAEGEAQPGALALLRTEMARREELGTAVGDSIGAFREERVLEQLRDVLC